MLACIRKTSVPVGVAALLLMLCYGTKTVEIERLEGIATGWITLAVMLNLRFVRERLNNVDLMLVCLAMLAASVCFYRTDIFYRLNDLGGHADYIIAMHDLPALPSAQAGWETYQPPSYYVLAYGFFATAMAQHFTQPLELVRGVSMCFWAVFLVYTAAWLTLMVRYRPAVYLILLLLAFWPIGMATASKINNDVPMQAFAAVCLYYFVRWQQTHTSRHLLKAVSAGLVAITFKTTGVLYCCALALAALWECRQMQYSFRILWPGKKAFAGVLLLALFCCGINFGRTFYSYFTTPSQKYIFVANMRDEYIRLWDTGLSENRLSDYFIFDPVGFVKTPTVLADPSNPSHRYFLNAVGQTLIFGNQPPWKAECARQAASALFLAMLLYSAASAVCNRASSNERRTVVFPLLLSLISVLALAWLRFHHSVAGFGEARYILYVMPVLLMCFARAQQGFAQSGKRCTLLLGWLIAGGLLVAFAICDVVQYV